MSVVTPFLLFLFISKGKNEMFVLCNLGINCQWGPYGDWSECDGCTKSQTRSRVVAVYAQFGGNSCPGGRTETRPCETTRGCPLEDGCGGRFRCRSGKCISQSLVCNGDQDCEGDGLDEHCPSDRFIICTQSTLPPNVELLGLGFDVVSEQTRASVINTKSFGGQCRTIYSGVHQTIYRLPVSTLQYSFMVKVQNDFSDEMFSSKWHYAKSIVQRERASGTTTGYRNYDFRETEDRTRVRSSYRKPQMQKLLVLKNEIEVAQFQSNSPQYIPLSEELWKALVKLPSVYDYAAYRKVLERFGTHYLSEGSLGGTFKVVAKIDEETQRYMRTESSEYNECEETKYWILFFSFTRKTCRSGSSNSRFSTGTRSGNHLSRVDVVGGGVQHSAALSTMSLDDPNKNWEMYSNWADSVRSFPQVTKQKLRPLSELVKEVQCAGVKKMYLRRAIEQYLSESDPCHCQPCRNNGLVFTDGNTCKCVCKPGTSGLACEQGTEIEGQQGVIQGSWACWSTWSSCNGARRSRSRSCSNPAPQNGGQYCSGESTETSDCDEDELSYLKTMEPQCFDQTLPESHKCETPPPLINGYIMEPKDIYLVGSKVEYTCISGFHLGSSTIECTENKTWSSRPGLCIRSACQLGSLAEGVMAYPINGAYSIGDTVTLSCPEGRQLLGESEITCDPSLNFSPDPASISCSPVKRQQTLLPPEVQCQPGKKPSKGKCVCKMPFECRSSLEVCTTVAVTNRPFLLTVCKMHALRCLGKRYLIAEDGVCEWPQRNTTGCTNCHLWELCDDQTNECRCKDSADCSDPGVNVCVRVGADGQNQTMSECEAGLKRCKGEQVSVVSILPCTG
uniref:Complement component C7 n=1 Tax=Tetraodon nigroviridis TaxID=99883 RepID=H3C1J3_TETNG